MANSFGSLYVGASGIQNSQHGLNVVANNLSNLDTTGYVRQRTFFADQIYLPTGKSAISNQQTGLGLKIGDVIHKRDEFLDRAYRQENGRQAYYNAAYEATGEVETFLREGEGTAFSSSITDLYDAFNQFVSRPEADEVDNLVIQKSQLFISRAKSVYQGLVDYQTNINQKIKDDISQINSIGKQIHKLNISIQATEAGGVETAMADRDARDKLIDDLSKLADITVKENPDGVARVNIEGVEFVGEDQVYPISIQTDRTTGFVTPYWPQLSISHRNGTQDIKPVFSTYLTDTSKNQDIGEVKSLLLMRGDHYGTYRDFLTKDEEADGTYREITSYEYSDTIETEDGKKPGLGKSVIMNAEAELDRMLNTVMTNINNYFSPVSTLGTISSRATNTSTETAFNKKLNSILSGGKQLTITPAKDDDGNPIELGDNLRIFDQDYAIVGEDGEIPSRELFSRSTQGRYTKASITDGTNSIEVYVYRPESESDLASQYTLSQIEVNQDLIEQPNRLPHRHLSGSLKTSDTLSDPSNLHQNDDIAYDVARRIYECWDNENFRLNPSDITPTSFTGFYTKYIGELADNGNIYKTNSEVLTDTVESIESSRQGVIGVNTDEELENMIKYQNAYNASSRFVNAITQMIDVLLNSLT